MVTAQSSAAKKVHCTTDRTARRNKQGNTREKHTHLCLLQDVEVVRDSRTDRIF